MAERKGNVMPARKPLESPLDRALRRVMLTLPKTLSDGPLPVLTDDGEAPIVVALPTEQLADVQRRIDAAGGHVNLFVAYPEHLTLAQVSPGLMPDTHVDVHPDSTVEMLVAWLRAVPTQTGSFSVSAPQPARVKELAYAEAARN